MLPLTFVSFSPYVIKGEGQAGEFSLLWCAPSSASMQGRVGSASHDTDARWGSIAASLMRPDGDLGLKVYQLAIAA